MVIPVKTRRSTLPPGLDPAELNALPNGPGVYYFYGETGSLLYVGKSVNLRRRVRSHFTAECSGARAERLYQQVRKIRATTTTGELSALLLEAQEIKTRQPLFNRRLRRVSRLYSIQLADELDGLLRPQVVEATRADRDQPRYGLFPSVKKARDALARLGREQGLCEHVLITPAPLGKACMSRQLKRCRGLCIGEWSVHQHNVAFQEALGEMALRAWPFDGPVALIEQTEQSDGNQSDSNSYTVFVIDNWCLLATVEGCGEPDFHALTRSDGSSAVLDKDIYRYLVKAIDRPTAGVKVVPLPLT